MLTPMDIHKKEFKSAFGGYNKDEVDDFLDDIVADFEKLYRENTDYKEKVANVSEKVDTYATMERTLQDTLIVAQNAGEEVIHTAKAKGELIVSTANDQARRIVEEANKKIANLEAEQEELKKRVQIFKTRFRTLLESELDTLNDELKDF